MSETVKLTGFRELDQKLATLGEEVARTILFDGVREGAEIIAVEAQRNAPKRKGILSRNIKVRMGRRTKGVVEAKVGTTKKAWYARLVEFGTAPHRIVAKKGGLADKATGKFFGKKVDHPGTAPRPFLRPALEKKRQAATDAIGRAIWWGITLHTKRHL